MFYFTEDGKETSNGDAPENNPQYTTVYVGNLGSEVRNFLYSYFQFVVRTKYFINQYSVENFSSFFWCDENNSLKSITNTCIPSPVLGFSLLFYSPSLVPFGFTICVMFTCELYVWNLPKVMLPF